MTSATLPCDPGFNCQDTEKTLTPRPSGQLCQPGFECPNGIAVQCTGTLTTLYRGATACQTCPLGMNLILSGNRLWTFFRVIEFYKFS
jgi:hypothetical protein